MAARRAPLVVAIGLTLAAARALSAQDSSPALTLDAALARALASNPSIAAARLRRPVDAAGVGVARDRPNPEVAFEASRDGPTKAVTTSIPIELGGKRGRRIDLATATIATGVAVLDFVIAEVQSEVRRSYFEVVAAERRVVLADESRQLATRVRDAVKARATAGDVAQADLTQAELALAVTDDESAAARGGAAAARAELNALLGQPVPTPLRLVDDMTSGSVPVLEAAMAEANRANAELLVLTRRITEQTARRDLARALQTPDLTAGGGATFDAPHDFTYGWKLSFAVTVPLFTRHRAGVQVEDAELARLRAEREAVTARVTGAVAAALARLSSARDRLTAFQNTTLPLVQQVEQNAQVAYTAGQQPIAALLLALQQTRETRKLGLQIALEFQVALAELHRAIGAPVIR